MNNHMMNNLITSNLIDEVTALRHQLHQIPELSFQEVKTKKLLMQFLEEKTDLQVVDCGQWFYAYYNAGTIDTAGTEHVEPASTRGGSGRALAFRADFDAVKGGDGNPHHFCGHDGHASALLGLGMYISQTKPERPIYLVFQPAEEIGKGAEICLPFLLEKGVSEIYGFHNIPGFPKNSVLLLKDTFACASTGLEIKISGTVSHAAYPEAGKNPARIVSKLILEQDKITQNCQERFGGLVKSTVIGVDIGSQSYGVSAGEGVLRLTLRAEKEEAFQKLKADICSLAEELSGQKGLNQDVCNQEDFAQESFKCSFRWIEEFPATVNHKNQVEKVRKAALKAGKTIIEPEEPFRWSEDFGHYLQKIPGAFFGIGAGENTPQLHTEKYEFPDEILKTVLEIYAGIID